MSRSRSSSLVTVIVGFAIIGGLILAGWIPRDCPYLKSLIATCPKDRIAVPETAEERDIARIPHQTIDRQLANFLVDAQDFRKTTAVHFLYRGDLETQQAYLALNTTSGFRELALVSHPLLRKLTWQRYTNNNDNETLFQQNETYQDIASLRAKLPPANTFAVDRIIAKKWGLNPDQYTDLTKLTSLDGISTIATTYTPSQLNGGWSQFDHTFDASDAFVNKDNQLEWRVLLPNIDASKIPFRMSAVNVDYKTMQ